MGRKSVKAKEKKMKRKEESSKVAVKQAGVDAANALEDPMADLAPFRKYDRNGLCATISCHRVTAMDPETVEWAFQLTKSNMQTLYENSDWGWSDKQKKDEMAEDKAWYLIARNEEQKPIGMVHFRFDLDFDDEVLYCYEIQLEKEARKMGLGKFLMQILALMAHKTSMTKVMVTVFKDNYANNFFKNKLKYEVDETSPEETMEEAMFDVEGYSYEILSKQIGPRKAETNDGTTNGCS